MSLMRDQGVEISPMGPDGQGLRLDLGYRHLLNEIRRLDAELGRTILSESDYGSLVVGACSGNIHWSLSMEGHPFSAEEMRRMCSDFSRGIKVAERGNIPQQAVRNHMETHLHRDRWRLPLQTEDVLSLHSSLHSSCGYAVPPGEWRQKQAPGGAAPGDIEIEMANLLNWASHSPYDELLTSLLFLESFLAIRPFDYGNDVTGRAIFIIMLSELGLSNCRLCQMQDSFLGSFFPGPAPMEGPAMLSLARSAATQLLESYKAAREAFCSGDILRDLDEHSRILALWAKEEITWRPLADAYAWLPDLSEGQVRQKLNRLVSMGVLEKEGRTRATRFRFKDPFLALRGIQDEAPL